MSQANSAARKRRAGGASMDSQSPAQTTPRPGQTPVPGGLTLPQVIAVVDARLIKLETFMKETQQSAGKTHTPMPANVNSYNAVEKIDTSEFDEKFEVLANEIADLKDIVLKLQSYTMEVNKMLMEERITVLSDMDEHVTPKSKEVTFNLTEIEEP
jgi:hypothetical protein